MTNESELEMSREFEVTVTATWTTTIEAADMEEAEAAANEEMMRICQEMSGTGPDDWDTLVTESEHPDYLALAEAHYASHPEDRPQRRRAS